MLIELTNDADKMYKNLFYVSHARPGLTQADLVELFEQASRNNQRLGLTGYLLVVDDMFMQFLEGPRHTLDALMVKVKQDPRHSDVHTFITSYSSTRHFPDWSMRCLPLDVDDFRLVDELKSMETLACISHLPNVDVKLHAMMTDFYEKNLHR